MDTLAHLGFTDNLEEAMALLAAMVGRSLSSKPHEIPAKGAFSSLRAISLEAKSSLAVSDPGPLPIDTLLRSRLHALCCSSSRIPALYILVLSRSLNSMPCAASSCLAILLSVYLSFPSFFGWRLGVCFRKEATLQGPPQEHRTCKPLGLCMGAF